ncbi:TPA: SctD family type III secretion system inner membrane ring subunit AscD [Aeromonas salmonicida subsp. salmonicida]|uniref:SctD family type III secretion system inner membrane ring subunit AscD n=1 Tax=Aeromonas salmonicida TaxID=645 RepID=UPI00131FBDA6|nr:SctD family type III secretion system inner membrane ring subunit AscD [Aeromonas salmonicida]ELI6418980.1 SctD family type III secretion system inner membrane ring subunit AscD [Aeromonas salmonicida subsp. salmonicida]QHE45867.1 EscD/YscD/HrpQ family type III secretion system inner membrane ring protein [Aeromonas salmonicida subsp. salmonicida]QHE49863.1 EscD/YscD/HrpQ family type III secretion system inner membrane ring protein [Aeromonas salmonicida subsp. salmonicida]QJF57897.1 SctD fa
MSWKCRVYRGLNRGVEVPLPEGRLVIGSDPLKADLVLVDEGMAPEHLVLLVNGEGITLQAWADGITPTQDGVALTAGEALRAETRLEAGPLLWSFCDSSRSLPEQLEALAAVVAPARAPRRRPAGADVWMGALCLSLVVAVVLLLGTGWWHGADENESTRSEQALKRFLAAPNYRQVVLNSSDPELWQLSGYVDENSARLALQQYLDSKGFSYRLELRTMEDLRQGAGFILQKLGYEQLQIRNGKEPGWLKLSGEIQGQDGKWSTIESLLKQEVPGLLGVENQVQIAGAYRKRLDALLKEQGLAGALRVREAGGRLELSGQLDERQLGQFQQVNQQFRREFGTHPTLELINQTRTPRQDELAFDVRSVSFGRVPYVVLADNQRYPIGGATSSGVRVLAIRPDAVVVSKGKQQYIVKLKGAERYDDQFGSATFRR